MINILHNISDDTTAQDDLWMSVSSDNSGQTDFKYVFDLLVGGNLKLRVKKFPEPSNGYGYFDCSPVLKGQFTYDWFTPLSTVYCADPGSGQAYIDFDVQVGEDYSGVTTLNDASATTRTYNFRPPLFKRRTREINDKLNKYITNRPLTVNANIADNLFIGLLSDASGLTCKVDTYDGSNTLIANNVDSGHTVTTGFNMLNVGTVAINTLFGSSIITDAVKYYDVWFNSLEKLRVYLICNGKYSPVLLHFINEWGQFDTARFGLVKKLTMDVERKDYSQKDYSLATSTPTYFDTNNVYRETKINYGNKYDHSYRLTMDAPTDAEYEWLAELINSPLIYAEIDGYYYPVTIKNNNYEYSTVLNNRLKVLEIDIELNQTRYSHQR